MWNVIPKLAASFLPVEDDIGLPAISRRPAPPALSRGTRLAIDALPSRRCSAHGPVAATAAAAAMLERSRDVPSELQPARRLALGREASWPAHVVRQVILLNPPALHDTAASGLSADCDAHVALARTSTATQAWCHDMMLELRY